MPQVAHKASTIKLYCRQFAALRIDGHTEGSVCFANSCCCFFILVSICSTDEVRIQLIPPLLSIVSFPQSVDGEDKEERCKDAALLHTCIDSDAVCEMVVAYDITWEVFDEVYNFLWDSIKPGYSESR
ncbi:hypothetical protein CHS0354_023048 [Potamilus streckersoni]|uniref:Uncharacterized protein n=1 Tax=Potamilus streckersoni TaxID=2493646 RepID=A0AAE0RW47_9BIVA|nr:hypothetical protein CHS0354_023048 [Potamilus streckersoni]